MRAPPPIPAPPLSRLMRACCDSAVVALRTELDRLAEAFEAEETKMRRLAISLADAEEELARLRKGGARPSSVVAMEAARERRRLTLQWWWFPRECDAD